MLGYRTHLTRVRNAPTQIFEYCSFEDVDGFMSKWRPMLNQKIICHWMRHVTVGLQFLAFVNTVHAELKPKNILDRADKTIVVAERGHSFVPTTHRSVTASEECSVVWKYMASVPPRQVTKAGHVGHVSRDRHLGSRDAEDPEFPWQRRLLPWQQAPLPWQPRPEC